MMDQGFLDSVAERLQDIATRGLTKTEQILEGHQGPTIVVSPPIRQLINLCANNYLGLADDPQLVNAARTALDVYGLGMASVRFICGTTRLHLALEQELADWLGTDDAILFSSCFDANGGVFEALLGPEDAIISDSLNHASLIDGIRLCKARRYRYPSQDLAALEAALVQARRDGARNLMIATDGVFSMDGTIAPLPAITALAERHGAVLLVDDSHAVGLMGGTGAGTPEHWGITTGAIILTGTFGKALGGAAGGYVAGPGPVIDLLRQVARPYLFSNSLPPPLAAAALAAVRTARGPQGVDLRTRLEANRVHFSEGLRAQGWKVSSGGHPILPIIVGDAARAQKLAAFLMDQGVYLRAFSFPVVPEGSARVRTQVSAAHTSDHITTVLDAFDRARSRL